MKTRGWWLGALLVCRLAAAADAGPLNTGFDLDKLWAKLHWTMLTPVDLTGEGLRCQFIRRPGAPLALRVAVWPGLAEAEQAFGRAVAALPHPRPASVPPLAGDACVLVAYADDHAEVVCRRRNVLLAGQFAGTAEAVRTALRTWVATLDDDGALCPRGSQCSPPPELELDLPALVPAETELSVAYRQPETLFVRTPDNLPLHVDGRLALRTGVPGSRSCAWTFMSAACVPFAVKAQVNVVAAAELPTAAGSPRWVWPESRLLFKGALTDDWAARPAAEQESLALVRTAYGRLQQPGPWRQRAWNELAGLLATAWLPPVDGLDVYRDVTAPPPHLAYVAAWQRRGVGFAVHGELGRGVSLYAEQPETTAERDRLTAGQLCAPGSAAPWTSPSGDVYAHRVTLLERSLHRLRALRPDGPWEPVAVLLAELCPAANLLLRFPGYSGDRP